jgi:hypothetical protein
MTEDLVLRGIQRATATPQSVARGLASTYRVTQVDVVPFGQVDTAFALDAGVGDGSLAAWRRTFLAAYPETTDETPVVLERFTVVEPAPTPELLFLAHSVRKLWQMRNSIEDRLGQFSVEQVWAKSKSSENSVGNLVLHLCGNVRYYIGHGIAGQPNIRDRALEFAATSHEDLPGLLRSTIAEATLILATLPPERLTDPLPEDLVVPPGISTVLELIYQIVGHFQLHTGQIIFAAKRL